MILRENVLTVSQLNAYVKEVLWRDELLRQVAVIGEMANVRMYGGHMYFTLKDEKASVRAVMWRNDVARLKFVAEEGMSVIAMGYVSVFERDGNYQLYVSYMEPSGLGALYVALEQLKKKLEAEGLFSQERKRPLPFLPRKVGIVTSTRGAAIRDIVTVGRRRFRGVRFVVADSRVQGDGAAEEIARGIELLNGVPGVDVIIVGRGGGAQEDLWCFNSEIVARAIFCSRVPVVSAVGHERDVTIADLVADVRAATPSNAAELVVPDVREVRRVLEGALGRGKSLLAAKVAGYRRILGALSSRPCLTRPDWRLVENREKLISLNTRLEEAIEQVLDTKRARFRELILKMDALSPLKVLARGWSLARVLPDRVVLKDSSQVRPGSRIEITLRRGLVECTVDRTIPPATEEREQQEGRGTP
ncbi:MAG TPA: exodeoxyribonuclease VII large subunit [Firmicutes bacterium]|nr:exodeoxyribonuclease VII large subunit [Candidatus Fermentithermobacillaceae bacterium]